MTAFFLAGASIEDTHGAGFPAATAVSEWDRQLQEAASRRDFDGARRVLEARFRETLNRFLQLATEEQLRPIHSGQIHLGQATGSCLGDLLDDGDLTLLDWTTQPAPMEIATFAMVGIPVSQTKVFLGSAQLSDVVIPEYGDRQPKELHYLLETNPFAIAALADFDLAQCGRVIAVWSEARGYRKLEPVTPTPEQRERIGRVFAEYGYPRPAATTDISISARLIRS